MIYQEQHGVVLVHANLKYMAVLLQAFGLDTLQLQFLWEKKAVKEEEEKEQEQEQQEQRAAVT